jgi:Domain of unknown function (DUF5655)/Domain of unknown function (DUF4287)
VGKVDDAVAAQLRNIETTTNRSIAEWKKLILASGLLRHGQIVGWLKAEHNLSHGNANRLAIEALAANQTAPPAESLIDAQYAGAKQHLRPLCDRIVALASGLGADVEVSPKKTSISIRRNKQFALIEVPSAKRVRVGFNHKAFEPTDRLKRTTGMCTHTVDLTSLDDIDTDFGQWLRIAYESA